MKFKGFWKSLYELNKQSLAWLKDYWFAYVLLFIIVYIVGALIFYIPAVMEELEFRKCLKKAGEGNEDFLD